MNTTLKALSEQIKSQLSGEPVTEEYIEEEEVPTEEYWEDETEMVYG